MNRLLLVLVLSIVDDVEELELVDTLGGGHDAEPVTELVLLEELLGAAEPDKLASVPQFIYRWSVRHVQVLEVAARELVVGNDLDLALALLADDNGVAEVADAALDLDALLEELGEGTGVEDLVASGLRSVDHELEAEPLVNNPGYLFPRRGKDLREGRSLLTFLVVFWPLPGFFCNGETKKNLSLLLFHGIVRFEQPLPSPFPPLSSLSFASSQPLDITPNSRS